MTVPIIFGALAIVFIGALMWALCRAAGLADQQRAIHDDETTELAEILHFDCERRQHRDARNGLGKAS